MTCSSFENEGILDWGNNYNFHEVKANMWDGDNSRSDCCYEDRGAFLRPCLLSGLQRMRGGFKGQFRPFLLKAISSGTDTTVLT